MKALAAAVVAADLHELQARVVEDDRRLRAVGDRPPIPRITHDCGEVLPQSWDEVRGAWYPRTDQCACKHRARALKLTQDNEVPRRYRSADLTGTSCAIDKHNEAGILKAASFVERMIATPTGFDVPGFGLCGEKGTGKTYIAWAVVTALRNAAIPALGYTIGDLDDAFDAVFRKDDEKADLINRLSTAPLLFIDDLGKEYARVDGTETYFDAFVSKIIDRRYNACLPIVVTTNHSPLDLEEIRYRKGDRMQAVIDRLHEIFENGKAWINVGGPSRRTA